MNDDGNSVVLDLLAADEGAVQRTLEAPNEVNPAGVHCVEAVPRCFDGLKKLLAEAGGTANSSRERGVAFLVFLICERLARWATTDLLRGRRTAVLDIVASRSRRSLWFICSRKNQARPTNGWRLRVEIRPAILRRQP